MLKFPIRMRYLDLGVILAYLAAITWFGARFRSASASLKNYFLGGRTAPWWAISLSIISAETSTLTIVGTPALSFTGNFGFLQKSEIARSEEHTSELQSRLHLVCRLLLEKKKMNTVVPIRD